MKQQQPTITDLIGMLDALSKDDWAETFAEFHKPLRNLYVEPESAALRLLWACCSNAEDAIVEFCRRPQAYGALLIPNGTSTSAEIATYLASHELPNIGRVAHALKNHAKLVEQINALRRCHPNLMRKAEQEHRIRETQAHIRLLAWFDGMTNGEFLNGHAPEAALQETIRSTPKARQARTLRRRGRSR